MLQSRDRQGAVSATGCYGLRRYILHAQKSRKCVDGRKRKRSDADVEKDNLYEQLGRLKVELDWPRKWVCSTERRRQLLELEHPEISLRRQCELLSVNRSGLYYQARGESPENLMLMRLIDDRPVSRGARAEL